jgi:hypothetical protein
MFSGNVAFRRLMTTWLISNFRVRSASTCYPFTASRANLILNTTENFRGALVSLSLLSYLRAYFNLRRWSVFLEPQQTSRLVWVKHITGIEPVGPPTTTKSEEKSSPETAGLYSVNFFGGQANSAPNDSAKDQNRLSNIKYLSGCQGKMTRFGQHIQNIEMMPIVRVKR